MGDEWVMMPVPEDLVSDVRKFVLAGVAGLRPRREGAATAPHGHDSRARWDVDAVHALFEQADEPTRALLSVIARAALTGDEITDSEAARALELRRSDVVGMVDELSVAVRADGRPDMIGRRRDEVTLPNGRTRTLRLLVMDAEVAALVREAEIEDLRGDSTLAGLDTAGAPDDATA